MTKSQEKISAWYDGEVTQKEFNAGLSDLTNLADSKQALHQFALLSELMQRKKRLSSKVTKIREYASKNNMWISNALTAAATVLVTITILFQIDSDRFGVDKDRQMQLTSALSSPEAKNQSIVADQDVMDHIIHMAILIIIHPARGKLVKSWIGASSCRGCTRHFHLVGCAG